MAGKSRTGTITLETVIKRFETLDAILVKLEASVSKNNKDQSNQATIREAEIEERVLRSVNDQVDVAMAKVNATTIRELMNKKEGIELRVGQQMGASSSSSPNFRSTEGYGAPIFERAES
jgi:hypothetical protein